MLRYVLYESSAPQVTLKNDTEFIQDYISLMAIRVTDKTTLKVNIDISNPGIKIAPLMFISLVENAFKHGVSVSEQSEILVNITERDGIVSCITENRDFSKNSSEISGSGIGISNLKKRLQLLYPNRYSFESHVSSGGEQYISKLEIKLA